MSFDLTVRIEGTLTADPELRFTAAGKAVASINVAVNERRKNPDTQQWEDGDATFLRGSVWNQMAENVAESLKKGDRVLAFGQLKQRSYETREGEKRTVYEFTVDAIGPSLKWATAQVRKAGRSASNGGQQQGGYSNSPQARPGGQGYGSGYQQPPDDPWTSPPGGYSDEPPF